MPSAMWLPSGKYPWVSRGSAGSHRDLTGVWLGSPLIDRHGSAAMDRLGIVTATVWHR